MALIDISSPKWQFDDEANEVIACFTNLPDGSVSDPASWSPTKQYFVKIAAVTPPEVVDIPQPPPEEPQ